MLRRTLMLSLLVVTVISAADEVPTDKPAPPAATEKSAQAGLVTAAAAEETAALAAALVPKAEAGAAKTLSGISILGNQDAPKALVIVPWKSSEIGDPLGLDENLDGSRRPVDKEVFMRELDYYDIKSGSK
jgi:hypothetical protein